MPADEGELLAQKTVDAALYADTADDLDDLVSEPDAEPGTPARPVVLCSACTNLSLCVCTHAVVATRASPSR